MYPRTNYEMTQADCDVLLAAMKPVLMIMLHIGGGPRSPQENANNAWRVLGKKMGFEWNTVRPIEGKSMLFFSAVPSENETQREERLKREAAYKRKIAIKNLADEITQKQATLNALLDSPE